MSYSERKDILRRSSKAVALLLLALGVSYSHHSQLLAVEPDKNSSTYLRDDRTLKEAWARAGGFMRQLEAIESVEEADAVAAELAVSISKDSVLWEALRRKGFMELDIFWEKEKRLPTFFNLIQDLKKKGFLTPALRTAIENWHARLGHHFSVWTHRQPLKETELAWLRQDLAHELRLFREKHSASIGSGDGLSNETPLTILLSDDEEIHQLALQFAKTVAQCGVANYALFNQRQGDDSRLILQIYGIQWETGEGCIFYFDVSSMIPRKTGEK